MATILMIEDDHKFYRMMDKVLGAKGHNIIHAGTALDGIQQAERGSIDLVLLDIDLPDLDGKVVATTLRVRPNMRGVPIIAVTAQDDSITRRLVMAFGCDGFIPKPVNTRTFPGQIQAFLDR